MTEIVCHAELEWKVPAAAERDASGAILKRATITEGHGGFHSHVVHCPPGYVLPPHSHDHGELFVILRGSAIVGDRTLGQFDTVAIPAEEVYGLRAGPDGLEFMVVRNGAASVNLTR